MEQQKPQKKHWLGETAKDRRNNIVVAVLSAILIVVVVLFILQRRDHQMIVNQINAERDSIQVELNEMIISYDSLQTENDTLNEELFYAQTKVKDLLLEVEQTKKVSYETITQYQNQINTLRGIMQDYIVQVDSLNRRNQALMEENQEVKEQYRIIESQNQQLSQEKEQLQQNLQRASMLEARDLVAMALNQRSKETKYARRAEKIRVDFTLSKNVTTRRGNKELYIRIMRPDQLLLSKSEDNLFAFEDLRIQYSEMREVTYEGNDLPVSIYWDNIGEPELLVGEYIINVFTDGNEIGETSFTLK